MAAPGPNRPVADRRGDAEDAGQQVAERVRAMRPGIRVVFLSGYAESALSHKGILDPGIVLVEKPFSDVSLLTQIREVLDR